MYKQSSVTEVYVLYVIENKLLFPLNLKEDCAKINVLLDIDNTDY